MPPGASRELKKVPMTKKHTTKTSKGYSTGDTVRHVFVDKKEVSRAYCKADGTTREYAQNRSGGFHSTYKRG